MPSCVIISGGVTRTFLDHGHFSGFTPNHTFTLNFGTTDASSVLVAGVAVSGLNVPFTSVTIGGLTATQQKISTRAGFNTIAIYTAPDTGSNSDVVVTMPGNCGNFDVQLYRINGFASETPNPTDSSQASPLSVTLNVPAGSVVIGSGHSDGAGSTTWTGIIEDVDVGVGVTDSSASAEFLTADAALSVTATFTTSTRPIGVFAVWGP